jgi:hypothetical protein
MRQPTEMQQYRTAVAELLGALEFAARCHKKVYRAYCDLRRDEKPFQAVSCWSAAEIIANPEAFDAWKRQIAAQGFSDLLQVNDPARLAYERQQEIERSREQYVCFS